MAYTRSMITGFDGGDPGSPPSDAKGSLGIGAVIGLGAASLLGSVFSAIFSNEANKNLVEKQNQESLAQWNRENAYNNPSAQMSRLAAAGLNPNLMYGNGTGSLLSAPSPELHAAHNNPVVDIDPLTAAQIANINADTDSKRSATARANELQPFNVQQAVVDIDKSLSDIKRNDSEISVNATKKYLNLNLGRKAYNEALEHYENYRYLNQSLGYRLDDIRNTALKSGYDAVKLNVELNYLESTLQQQLVNLKATHSLILEHASYFRESAAVQSINSAANVKNAEAHMKIADSHLKNADTKLKEVEGRLERWNDQTTNERIKLATDISSLAYEIFTGQQVSEVVEKTVGGGKPSATKSKFSRKRLPKTKPVNPAIKFLSRFGKKL